MPGTPAAPIATTLKHTLQTPRAMEATVKAEMNIYYKANWGVWAQGRSVVACCVLMMACLCVFQHVLGQTLQSLYRRAHTHMHRVERRERDVDVLF